MKHLKILTICALAVLCAAVFAVVLCPATAAAESVAEETFADYFERVWLDKLLGYAGVLLGAVSAIAITVTKVKKAHQALVSDSAELARTQRALADTQQRLADAEAAYLAATEEMRRSLEAVCESQRALGDTYGEAYATLDSLRQAVTLGFCNDRALVQNGYARQIAEVLGVKDENA